jgi:osmotically inducible protein OsmC
MAVRNAEAVWEGTLKEGSGVMSVGSGAYEGKFSHASRFLEEPGSNPEELIGAALAGCFSMFLSSVLTNAGFPPIEIRTKAQVYLERDDIGPKVTKIQLATKATIPGIDVESFNEHVNTSKEKCPISRALTGVDLQFDATLTA